MSGCAHVKWILGFTRLTYATCLFASKKTLWSLCACADDEGTHNLFHSSLFESEQSSSSP